MSTRFRDLTLNSGRPGTSQTAPPSSLCSHDPAAAWGPLTPAAPSPLRSLLSFSPRLLPLTPFLPLSLIFSLCRLSELSRAPCVTRIIKTNTDLILIPNPIVLFFSSHRPCSMLGIRCPQPPPPPHRDCSSISNSQECHIWWAKSK